MKYLFIGGCADGEWRQVNIKSWQVIKVSMPINLHINYDLGCDVVTDKVLNYDIYDIKELYEEDKIYTVFVKRGMGPLISLLIKGYRRTVNGS